MATPPRSRGRRGLQYLARMLCILFALSNPMSVLFGIQAYSTYILATGPWLADDDAPTLKHCIVLCKEGLAKYNAALVFDPLLKGFLKNVCPDHKQTEGFELYFLFLVVIIVIAR